MPSSKNDRKGGIPFLDRFRDVHCLSNHGPCYERNAEAKCVFHLCHDPLFVVWRYGSIYDADLVSSFQQRSRNCKNAERGRGLDTGEGCYEEYDLFRRFHCQPFRRFISKWTNKSRDSKRSNRQGGICLRIVKTLQNPDEQNTARIL